MSRQPNELTRVRGIAEREQLRMFAELAKEVAEREKIEQRLAAASETHIRRSDANEAFHGHSERWKVEEQRQNAEYEMKLAEFKLEAQTYSLQSAGTNIIAHEFQQVLMQEQQLSFSEMRSEMKFEEASILAIAQQRVSGITHSEQKARETAIVLRTELQSELTVAELGIAGNAKLNIVFDMAEKLAYQESQELGTKPQLLFDTNMQLALLMCKTFL